MKIICATDFSEPAERAAQAAATLALRFGDTLVLANAFEPPAMPHEYSTMVWDHSLDDAIEKRRLDALKATATKLRALNLQVEERLLRGYPPQALNELAREIDARMIVVGTHGRRALPRVLLGSVAERTVMLSEKPVLVVHHAPAGVAPARADRPLRVVVGLEASAASRAAVAWVRELRNTVACDVHFVHFYWPPDQARRLGLQVSSEIIEGDPETTAILHRELAPLVQGLPGRGEVSLDVAPCWGSVAAALCVAASARDADFLLVGTHQRSGLERVRLGSNVQPVLHAATVPVLCVPATATPTAATHSLPVMHKLLVATDLSDVGNQAIPYAYGLLSERPGHVLLLHVAEWPRPDTEATGDESALSGDEERRLRLRLAALIPAAPNGHTITTDIVVVDGGLPEDVINQSASRFGADAIVLATRGRSGLAKAVLGSVTQAVVQKAQRPVVIVPPRPE